MNWYFNNDKKIYTKYLAAARDMSDEKIEFLLIRRNKDLKLVTPIGLSCTIFLALINTDTYIEFPRFKFLVYVFYAFLVIILTFAVRKCSMEESVLKKVKAERSAEIEKKTYKNLYDIFNM